MTTPYDAAKFLAQELGIPVNSNHMLTDYGNAERLVEWHHDDLRYIHQWRKWMAYDSTRWSLNNDGEEMRRAMATTRRMYQQASDLATQATTENDEATRAKLSGAAQALLKWAHLSESRARLDAMIALAAVQPGIPVHPDELDANHWLLNVLNGTVDLRTGDLLDHQRDDLLTKMANTRYDLEAECPLWLDFLDRIMGSDQEMIGFLQRALGYALTGDVREHVLFVLWGTGRNDKSTFLNTIMAMLSDYATKAPKDLLMNKDKQVHETETTELYGARFVASIETAEGKRLNEVQVKELTGGDPIKARRMREDFWQFWPTHKLFLATNHKPVIHGSDIGIWSRIRLIPFSVTIPPRSETKV